MPSRSLLGFIRPYWLERAAALHQHRSTQCIEPRTSNFGQEAQSSGQGENPLAESVAERHECRSLALSQQENASEQRWKDAHNTKMPFCGSEYSREVSYHRDPAPTHQEKQFECSRGIDGHRDSTITHEKQSSEQQRKDGYVVRSICRILQSQVWGPNTEPLLRPYKQDLNSHVVARVLLNQKNISISKSFLQWSGQAGHHDSHVFHAFLIKLGEAKLFDEMWQVLHEMRAKGCAVSGTSFSIIVKAYGMAGLPHQALGSIQRASEFDVDIETHVYTSLLGVLFKAKMVAEAKSIYERMMQDQCEFDGSVWATLIRGFSRNGLTTEAEECWKAMSSSGRGPVLIHYNAFIEGLCESNHVSKALELLNSLQKSGLKANAYSFNPLLAALCKAGRFSDAFELFRTMKNDCTPNQATYNMLLEGLFLDKDVSKAMEFYDMLEEGGWVDSRSYFLLAAGLRRAKMLGKLMSVSENLHAKYGVVNVWLCNALLHGLCDDASAAADIDEADSYFNRMLDGLTHPDVVSFATMINAYCKSNRIDDAKLLLSAMDRRGIKPNAFCYTPLIATVLKLGQLYDGLSFFKDMLSKGLEPNALCCSFLLRKLSDARMVDESLWVLTHICDRGFHVHKPAITSLIICLKKSGKQEKAMEVCETLEKRGCLVDGLPAQQALKSLIGTSLVRGFD